MKTATIPGLRVPVFLCVIHKNKFGNYEIFSYLCIKKIVSMDGFLIFLCVLAIIVIIVFKILVYSAILDIRDRICKKK